MGAAFEVYNVLGYGMAEEIGRIPELSLSGRLVGWVAERQEAITMSVAGWHRQNGCHA